MNIIYDRAIIIQTNFAYRFTSFEIICITNILDDENWDKVEQSLIYDDDKKFDKITIHHHMSDGEVVEIVFWFDITECYW